MGRLFDRVYGPLVAVLGTILGAYFAARIVQSMYFNEELRSIWRLPYFGVFLGSTMGLLAIIVFIRYLRTRHDEPN